MKTPRELLLHRHGKSQLALDKLRHQMVRSVRDDRPFEPKPSFRYSESLLDTLWQELFVAGRRYWMGLGVAWCVIVAFAVLDQSGRSGTPWAGTPPAAPLLQVMREQQQLRDELLGTAEVQESRVTRREPTLGPRSELRAQFVSV